MKKLSFIPGVAFALVFAIFLCGVSPAYAAGLQATPTKSGVSLNGKPLQCAAYNISGNNYFKLRDLMKALDIGVAYDGATNTIIIDTFKGYAPDGSETASPASPATAPATASPATASVTIDGVSANWTAYNIGGNNYFKLRDILQELDIYVSYSAEYDTVYMDTSKGYFYDDLRAAWQDADEQSAAEPPQSSPAAQTEAPAMTLDEMKAEIVRLTNAERAKAGAPELEVLPELMTCAQTKADDMRDNHYYGHNSPVYGTSGQMIKAAIPQAKSAGENIAPWTKTPQEAFNGWMDSLGHRDNILSPKYTHIGIGIVEGADGGYWWVQQFCKL